MSSGFLTRSEVVQPQKMSRDLKFQIEEVEGLYHLCSENKGTDQLCGYGAADLHLFFFTYAKSRFSKDTAHV